MEFNTKSTIGKIVKCNICKAMGGELKKQAISTGTNLLADIVAGNNLKEGIDREVGNIGQNAALGLQPLGEDNNCRELKRKTTVTNKKSWEVGVV